MPRICPKCGTNFAVDCGYLVRDEVNGDYDCVAPKPPKNGLCDDCHHVWCEDCKRKKNMKQLTLTIMCGLPGCGKSTWIAKNKKSNVVVSLDDIRHDIFGHQFHRNAEPWILALGKTMVKMLLKQGTSVIIDATNLLSFMRLEWIKVAKEYKAKIVLVHFDVPYETCYQRNKLRKKGKRILVSVLKNYDKIFQKPSDFFEFYDKTITVTE